MTIINTFFDLNKRFYKLVGVSSTETSDYVPADGEKVRFVNMGISSSAVPDTVACISWDADGTPELLISSYGEAFHTNMQKDIVGDGVKIIRISLTNDLTEPTYMGGFWQAVILP